MHRQIKQMSVNCIISVRLCVYNRYKLQNEAACHDHMQASGHDIMMGPMAVGGFVCPQCLMLYPEKEMAQAHMNSESHHSYTYQMAGQFNKHK